MSECHNCGMVDVPLTPGGFCAGCTCDFCGGNGSMDSGGMCSSVLDSYEACHVEQEACLFAVDAHGDQKYGAEPYVAHLRAVRQVLRDFRHPQTLWAPGVAAWLHDVIEDAKPPSEGLTEYGRMMAWRDKIAEAFGGEVASLVWAVTGEGPNRRNRVQSIYRKLYEAPAAIPIKVADRIANVEACAKNDPGGKLAIYQQEHDGFVFAMTSMPSIQRGKPEIVNTRRLVEMMLPRLTLATRKGSK